MGSLEEALRERITEKIVQGDREGLQDILDEVNLEGSHERNEAALEYVALMEAKKKEWQDAEKEALHSVYEDSIKKLDGDITEKTREIDEKIKNIQESVKENIAEIEADGNIDHKVNGELEPGQPIVLEQKAENKEYSTLTPEEKIRLLDSLETMSREKLLETVEQFPYSYSSDNRGLLAEIIRKGEALLAEDLLQIKDAVSEGGKYHDEMITSAMIKTEKLPLEEVKKILELGGGSFAQRAFMETNQYQNLTQEEREKFVGDLARIVVAQ